MVLTGNQNDGPLTKAAKAALETGNANHILIWIPEESENTLKNLLERACCARSPDKIGVIVLPNGISRPSTASMLRVTG